MYSLSSFRLALPALANNWFKLSVVQESRSCVVSVTGDQQFIARSISTSPDVNSMSSCGSRSNPWHLEAPLGQRINVSLIDFSSAGTTQLARDGVTCHQYGYIFEKSNKNNVSICSDAGIGGAKPKREKTVYSSETNSVDIVLFGDSTANSCNFLVKLNGYTFLTFIPATGFFATYTGNGGGGKISPRQ